MQQLNQRHLLLSCHLILSKVLYIHMYMGTCSIYLMHFESMRVYG